ncbi:RIMBP2 [Lepeophtheirus salmonis]|uniref:RIMBP2 n=1 Tax=Lepeophtheirus salmonis TaxID=72036 RepID=A0A7R8CIC4_LEPSM|nr:RIMBP2 [Lepeophtheirus salmonis]CAF2830344.1 RIMBP2 [Lepeophtheirus salmonis]
MHLESTQNQISSRLKTVRVDPLKELQQDELDEVANLQSQLREIDKKIELENVNYEELMLELAMLKKTGQQSSFQTVLQPTQSNHQTVSVEIHQQDKDAANNNFEDTDNYRILSSIVKTSSDGNILGSALSASSSLIGGRGGLLSGNNKLYNASECGDNLEFVRRISQSDTRLNGKLDGYPSDLNLINDGNYGFITTSADENSLVSTALNSPQIPKYLIDHHHPSQNYGTGSFNRFADVLAMAYNTGISDPFMFQNFNAPQSISEPTVDMLEIPGKGRCYVYNARYNYDPFQQSLNENPEHELYLFGGDYVLVWGDIDEDGFLEGELLDGRKGLSFLGLNDPTMEDVYETTVPQDLPLDFGGGNTTTSPEIDMSWQRPFEEDNHLLNATYLSPEVEVNCHIDDFTMKGDIDVVTNESPTREENAGGTIPAPRQLTLERQLNKSILIGWTAPDCPNGVIEMYHVYVDGFLRTTVRAMDKTRALVEGVDSARPHRISVRSVTVNRRTSKDAACTMIIGKDAPLGPSCVKASNITSTSSVISWLPSNIRTVRPGVYKHTITGLTPNTTYRVTVRAKNIKASPYVDEKSLVRLLEKLSAHTEFRTLAKGLPDPPMDVRVDGGPQDGTILVTWIPVTLNVSTTSGTATKAMPVTGYAVFADGKRVTDVDSPTSDHALVDLGCIGHFNPKFITVRSKSRDLLSNDSTAVPIQQKTGKKGQRITDIRGGRYTQGGVRTMGRTGRGRFRGVRDATGQLVIEHDEDNLSDKELYARNIPAIEITKDSASEFDQYSDEDYDRERRFHGRHHHGNMRRRRQHGHKESSRIFVALFDYDPPTMSPNPEACDEELPFREGQLIKVSSYDADGFYWGECGNKSGYVPCNMVSEVQVDDEKVAQELLKDDMSRGRGGRYSNRDRWELSPNVDSEVELSFYTGDVIYVYGEMDDDGFYLAELKGQRGLVPSNFLTDAPITEYDRGKRIGPGASGPPPPPRGPTKKESIRTAWNAVGRRFMMLSGKT